MVNTKGPSDSPFCLSGSSKPISDMKSAFPALGTERQLYHQR